MNMPGVHFPLRSKARALFYNGGLDNILTSIYEQLGLYTLGRHSENMGSRSAPLMKGFSKWRGKQNSRTETYANYKDWYAEQKKERGEKNWHISSGALFHDAIKIARVYPRRDGFKIRPSPGASHAYYLVQQRGRHAAAKLPAIPARPYYKIDDSDKKYLARFLKKQVLQRIGNGATVSI